ncbi:hypothetical protein MNBD_PLANCTO03-1981, partial [hydrothermal vent metagenome]
YRRPMLSGLPGVESGGAFISDKPRGYRDPGEIDQGKITIEREDGSKILLARSGRHLMAHIYQTLQDDERDLFTEQVLCEATRAEYRERGLDPGDAFDYLKTHEAEIVALFARMPMGEYTPGVFMRQVGGGVYRLALSHKASEGLTWRGFDMVWEGGHMETVGAPDHTPELITVPTLEEAVVETGSVSAAAALITQAKARQPEQRFVPSGWKLRWFVPGPPMEE